MAVAESAQGLYHAHTTRYALLICLATSTMLTLLKTCVHGDHKALAWHHVLESWLKFNIAFVAI